MPRPGRMHTSEKVKDFKGTMKRLFKDLEKWRLLFITSLTLALFSALLSTIAPNRLSKLTDVISEGIRPNTNKIQEISKQIYSNAMKNYIAFLNPVEEDTDYINSDNNKAIVDSDTSKLIDNFNKLDDKSKEAILEDIVIDGVTISTKDQIKFLNIVNSMDDSMVTDDLLKLLDDLPKSIKTLVEPKMNMNKVKKRALVLAIIYLLSSIFGYLEARIMAHISTSFTKKIRNGISTKINKLPLKYFDTHETGDLLSRVTNDVDTIGMQMNQSLSSLVASSTLFLGSIVMMFVTNYIMALTAIASSIIGFILSFILLKLSQKYFVQRQKELGNINAHIEETFSSHKVVKTYNGEREALEEFDRINSKLYDCNRKSQFLSGIMQPIMMFVGNFGYVAVCVVGAILVMNNKTSFGTIVAFMIYVRLFTNPLSQIAQSLTGLQSTAAAAERVYEFSDEEEQPNEKKLKGYVDKDIAKGNIEFKNVKFGYNENKTIINNFSAKAKSGEKIAIVGPTGAGKTTMVNLLMKFYEINDGDILIDGVSIKELTRENIHDLFIMVLQDTWLFDGTIRENIKYNKKDLTDEEIWQICNIVGIDHFIKTLPGGLDSQVGDNDNISQGQKQLLTIARGMVEDAPFLILDEATSNVDTRTEELVQKAMDKLTEGRTSFIIAHRLSTIKNADLILVMNNGNIIEQGTHDELMKKKGFYAKLYNSQFEIG